jgi:general secretion pathway protein G
VMTSQTGKRGFTLIELLAVIGIIIIIAGFILTVIPSLQEKSQIKGTEALLGQLEIAIDQYYNDNRSYPATGIEPTGIEDLKKAITPSDPTAKRYIELNRDELDGNNILDEWGNYLVYRNPGTQTSTISSYDLYSTGPDGVTNTFGNDADDINNWSQ